ncbi:MAG: hypothetical protein A3J74_02095 [Elusimicrobia bacterium RIFCSPHIGHO2_02_FULL_57_9]|nr:MAG: hypothetical protein A3J74_02095 [Elusimicrobia bacterium RIFCSPHIGHO2_02_FULL_57_9]
MLCSPATFLALAAVAFAQSDRLIQIGIILRTPELSFIPEGRFVLQDKRGRSYELTANQKYRLEAADDGLKLGDVRLAYEARFKSKRAQDAIRIGSKSYRGDVIVRLNAEGSLTVIEELNIETYLLGVLPYEMEPNWPIEALKSQAVVARTFAYTQMGKYKKMGFDLTSDTRSQVYGGAKEVHPSIRRAVQETRGEVLGYKNQILSAYYHSCCGGHTTDPRSVWGSDSKSLPPLRGVKDRYCRASPLARWTAYFSNSDIAAALQKNYDEAGPLKGLAIGSRDSAGRVKTFAVKLGPKTLEVPAIALRRWLGNTELKSSRVYGLRRRSKGIEFLGSGSGHGVGLCQWGARLQARKGRGYEQILKFYFPGSVLSVIDE